MASQFSPLKIELIGTGDQAGTWGATTNVNLGTAIEEAIVGSSDVTFVSGGNTAIGLIDTNESQVARNLRLNLTGSMTSSQYLFVPAIEKIYIINNTLSNSVIVSNGSNAAATGTSLTVPSGLSTIVYNTGTNIVNPLTYIPNLSNVTINGGSANSFSLTNVFVQSGSVNNITSNASTFSNVTIVGGSVANVSATNVNVANIVINGGTANGVQSSNVVIVSGTVGNTTINAYTEAVLSIGNTGNAVTLNIANATVLTATLTANCTFTMPTDQSGKSFILMLKTGNGGFTSTFVDVQWANGNSAPTITNTASKMDILTFIADGTNWYGNYSQNYPA